MILIVTVASRRLRLPVVWNGVNGRRAGNTGNKGLRQNEHFLPEP